MPQFPVTVRYRYSDGVHGDRDACFHGRFCRRSEAEVLGRLRELHRFAARIEVVEVRWRDVRGDGGGAAGSGSAPGSRSVEGVEAPVDPPGTAREPAP